MKQKVLFTYLESGFGHISSMDSISAAFCDKYSDRYDIQKSYIMHEDGFKHLAWMENFFVKQVANTNKIPGFGKFIFAIIDLLGGDHLMRFYHRRLARRSFRQGLEALHLRHPDVIVTNHYFTNLLAYEYKVRMDPDVVIINYNPDNFTHSFWEKRGGVFIANSNCAYDRALKRGFKPENLRRVNPCVREEVENCHLTREQCRDKFGLPHDKFTVAVADGGYMCGRGPKFTRAIIKSGLPITLCVLTGKNTKRYNEFKAIEEGRSKVKLPDGMTLKVFPFLDNAFELYGAADVFLTKAGPNAVLDSIYMRTPVMIDYCPHMIEETTYRFFVKELGCGEGNFTAKRAVERIKHLMADSSDLDGYVDNIEKFLQNGNGATAVADIINEEAEKQREACAEEPAQEAEATAQAEQPQV